MTEIGMAVVAAALADRDQLVAFAAMVLSCDRAADAARMGYDRGGGGISYITATGVANSTGMSVALQLASPAASNARSACPAVVLAVGGDRTSQPWRGWLCRHRSGLDRSSPGDQGRSGSSSVVGVGFSGPSGPPWLGNSWIGNRTPSC
jgi:hypothetical protein